MPLAPCDGAIFSCQPNAYLNFLRRFSTVIEFRNLVLYVVQPLETCVIQFGHRVSTDTEHIARIVEIVGIAVGKQAAHLEVVCCHAIGIS